MRRGNKSYDVSDSRIEFYKRIPVYPSQLNVKGHNGIAYEAPIAEDDNGSVCFLTEQDKKRWISKLYANKALKRELTL